MGGFFFINKKSRLFHSNETISKCKDIFTKKGLKLNQQISSNDFIIYTYYKKSHILDNISHFNEDFIISIGTFIYNSKIGKAAHLLLYEDLRMNKDIEINSLGHYCLITYINGKLAIRTDKSGSFHVYSDNNEEVISSSFLVLSSIINSKSLSIQEMYEYIFTGSFYGGKTLYNEVKMIDNNFVYYFFPDKIKVDRNLYPYYKFDNLDFSSIVETVSKELLAYFKILKGIFDSDITVALSSGYDTRLMLALMLSNNIYPKLYVSGSDESMDVKIAKIIASNKNLNLKHYKESDTPILDPLHYRELVLNKFYINDGLGYNGIFSSALEMDLWNSQNALLNLNGGGGEIYRNFWTLPDKSMKLSSFIQSKFEDADYSICTNVFSKNDYLTTLTNKAGYLIGATDENRINRSKLELLYPLLRLRYWTGKGVSKLNQLSYAISPFLEYNFINQASGVPIKYKHYGRFEAELIKFIDPSLAKFSSEYGINFFDNLSLKYKIKQNMKYHFPVFLRPIARKIKSNNYNYSPYFTEQAYLNNVFNSKDFFTSEYVSINSVKNSDILSRVYTIEMLYQIVN